MSLNAAEVNLKSSFYLAFDRLVTGQWSRVGMIPEEGDLKGRDDFWQAVPSLKYGQERFGSGNLYLSSISSNTNQHVHVQHSNFCEHANNAQRSNQHRFLLGYLQET